MTMMLDSRAPGSLPRPNTGPFRLAAVMAVGALVATVLAFAGDPAPAVGQTAFTCRGVPATHVGTNGDDVIIGTPGRDVVVARRGHDRIDTGDGDDLICAGHGRDNITSGAGDDIIDAGRSHDRVDSGPGDDRITGSFGDDLLIGGTGSDDLRGGAGRRDVVDGGPDFDRCWSETFTACEAEVRTGPVPPTPPPPPPPPADDAPDLTMSGVGRRFGNLAGTNLLVEARIQTSAAATSHCLVAAPTGTSYSDALPCRYLLFSSGTNLRFDRYLVKEDGNVDRCMWAVSITNGVRSNPSDRQCVSNNIGDDRYTITNVRVVSTTFDGPNGTARVTVAWDYPEVSEPPEWRIDYWDTTNTLRTDLRIPGTSRQVTVNTKRVVFSQFVFVEAWDAQSRDAQPRNFVPIAHQP